MALASHCFPPKSIHFVSSLPFKIALCTLFAAVAQASLPVTTRQELTTTPTPTLPPRAAYLEQCNHFSDCGQGLFCYFVSSSSDALEICDDLHASLDACFCFNRFRECVASSSCNTDEACVFVTKKKKNRKSSRESYCVPCDAINEQKKNNTSVLPIPIPVDDKHNCDQRIPQVTNTATDDTALGLYTLDECTTGNTDLSSCVSPRKCIDVHRSASTRTVNDCDENSKHCVCAPPNLRFKSCTKISDCDVGERCGTPSLPRSSSSSVSKTTICASCSASDKYVTFAKSETPSSSQCPQLENEDEDEDEDTTEDGENLCIAVDALTHAGLKRLDQLVYSNHFRAVVLCDIHDNCATPAHIVVHRGSAKTMREYCRKVKCNRKIKWVNSPKMKVGLRLSGVGDKELYYTPFATPWGWWIERKVVTWIVRMGI